MTSKLKITTVISFALLISSNIWSYETCPTCPATILNLSKMDRLKKASLGESNTIIMIDTAFDINHHELKNGFILDDETSSYLQDFNTKIQSDLNNLRLTISDFYRIAPILSFYKKDHKKLTSKEKKIYKEVVRIAEFSQNDLKTTLKTIHRIKKLIEYQNHGTHTAGLLISPKYGLLPKAKIIPVPLVGPPQKALEMALKKSLSLVKKGQNQNGPIINAVNISMTLAPRGDQAISSTVLSLILELGQETPLFVSVPNNKKIMGDTDESKDLLNLAENLKGNMILVGNLQRDKTDEFPHIENSQIGSSTPGLNNSYFLFAPGTNIKSTLPYNKSGYMSGTSMATPIALASFLIFQQLKDPQNTSPSSYLTDFLLHARKTHFLSGHPLDPYLYGNGIIDFLFLF